MDDLIDSEQHLRKKRVKRKSGMDDDCTKKSEIMFGYDKVGGVEVRGKWPCRTVSWISFAQRQ